MQRRQTRRKPVEALAAREGRGLTNGGNVGSLPIEEAREERTHDGQGRVVAVLGDHPPNEVHLVHPRDKVEGRSSVRGSGRKKGKFGGGREEEANLPEVHSLVVEANLESSQSYAERRGVPEMSDDRERDSSFRIA